MLVIIMAGVFLCVCDELSSLMIDELVGMIGRGRMDEVSGRGSF